jgi:hypothetical protein
MVMAEAGVLESDSAADAEAELRDAVAAVVRDHRDADWIVRRLRPLIGLEQHDTAVEGGRVEAFCAGTVAFSG